MAGTTIIILEDDADLREHYSLVLEDKGYTVVGASNSEHIIELIHKHSAQLVITDLFMPEYGGTEAIVKIFADYRIPVIAISAFDNLIKIVEPLVAAHLKKPITDSQLLSTVREVLDNS